MKILNSRKFSSRSIKFTWQEIEWPIAFPAEWGVWDQMIGIDPGNRNMGLSIFKAQSIYVQCYEINFPSERMAVPRAVQIRLAMLTVFAEQGLSEDANTLVCVEGSSFGSRFRNTELAEARITAAMFCMDNLQLTQNRFEFISPLKVRKLVFGNAKLRAEEQWPELKPDAASSVAVALAGLKLHQSN